MERKGQETAVFAFALAALSAAFSLKRNGWEYYCGQQQCITTPSLAVVLRWVASREHVVFFFVGYESHTGISAAHNIEPATVPCSDDAATAHDDDEFPENAELPAS